MLLSGIPIKFKLHCLTVAKTLDSPNMNLKEYLDAFNKPASADINIVIKKNIGKHCVLG